MKTGFALFPWILLGTLPLGAVYAPIPEQEQGKAWAVSLAAGAYKDSNIFGAQTNKIDSMVYQVSPLVSVNASVTAQTFLSGRYRLTLEHFDNRPGDSTLDSHDLSLRLAHSFRPGTTLDITESYQVLKNPASLLAGVPLNTDQSFKRNQLDGRFDTLLNPRLAASLKARIIDYSYDNAVLATSLDRTEWLFGAAAAYSLLPEAKAVAEYRYQDIGYEAASFSKDKESHFLLVGVDYAPGPKLTAHGRLGWEHRRRQGERSEDAPYAELSAKYSYGEDSYVAAGYGYTFEETSNVALYTDTKVNRFFVNLQHFLSPVLAASGSISYEPSVLQGRRNVSPDRDETTTRLGLALTYVGRRNWSVSATFDYDDVDSDDLVREMDRTRAGVSARYAF